MELHISCSKPSIYNIQPDIFRRSRKLFIRDTQSGVIQLTSRAPDGGGLNGPLVRHEGLKLREIKQKHKHHEVEKSFRKSRPILEDTIDSIYCGYKWQHNNYNDKTSVRFALMNDTPYFALMGEIWGVFHELYGEKYIAIYQECTVSWKDMWEKSQPIEGGKTYITPSLIG